MESFPFIISFSTWKTLHPATAVAVAGCKVQLIMIKFNQLELMAGFTKEY